MLGRFTEWLQKGGSTRLVAALLLAIILAAAATFAVTALLISIYEHKQEARNPFFRVVELTDDTEDPAVWGKNFPQQYDGYLRTVDMTRTRFGGSEALPHEPTETDPRKVVAFSRLEHDARLKTMWAGYLFARDFREERGHAYMLEDQTYTERVTFGKQPGTCLNCHASTYLPYKKLGSGDIEAGFTKLNELPYAEARKLAAHPVTCLDCHESQTMQLRITRPAFARAIKEVKRQQGAADFDVKKTPSRQEMRSFVCAQCHVEYYFQGPTKQLVYPWAKGMKADDILAYYDEQNFTDWTHAETGAKMLKAQHPEFEMWNQGVHSRAGVSCADCHMPYQRVGALKVSDHHVRSPLLNINRACQTCHNAPEKELLGRAETIQARTASGRTLAMDALMQLIGHIKEASGKVPEPNLNEARDFQRKATFLVDFIEAENSNGFHADQEAMRVLVLALDYCRKGEVALAAAR